MQSVISITKSSFRDVRCCDETDEVQLTAWRPQMTSMTCVVGLDGKKTGYAHISTLEEYTVSTGLITGNVKENLPSQPEYTPDYPSNDCPKDTDPSPPSSGTISFSNHIAVKGVLTIRRDGVVKYHTTFTTSSRYSWNVVAGVYDIQVETYMPDPNTPAACDIVIMGYVRNSTGNETIVGVNSPFSINIWAAGDGQNHLVLPLE